MGKQVNHDGGNSASMGPRFFNRGNGAIHRGIAHQDVASMGPRFFNRGNANEWNAGDIGAAGFNGAAVFQPRKRHGRTRVRRRHQGFNGAAVFQPRKRQLTVTGWGNISVLQWGRGFSTAETTFVKMGDALRIEASMGPRFFNRGNRRSGKGPLYFYPASMGPRFFNRGNDAARKCVRANSSLQWGRGFSTAETVVRPYLSGRDETASMGPRFFNRGNAAVARPTPRLHEASMGPRFFNRGNVGFLFCSEKCLDASMGPRFFNRGNVTGARRLHKSEPLQWGRGFSTAETPGPYSRSAATTCFNGAAVFQPRKPRRLGAAGTRRAGFNGAAVFQPRKRGDRRSHLLAVAASMGPRFFNRGNPDQVAGVERRDRASMGPRFFNRGNRSILNPVLSKS